MIEPRPYDDPDVSRLVAELQAEYVRIYGTPDETPVERRASSTRRTGCSWSACSTVTRSSSAVGAGSTGAQPTAEIKRMYVAERAAARACPG